MKYEANDFIIYYHECDQPYIKKLIEIMKERMSQILSFFKIQFQGKIIIKLYDNIDTYKDNLTASFEKEAKIESEKQGKEVEPRKYQDWMIANTEDGNINMLSFFLVQQIDDFKNYTEEEFLLNACHECTHLFQQQSNSNNPGWFWEVLATTLGNPECQHETTETYTIQDLEERFDEIDGYGAVYKIGKCLFEQYDEEYIESLVHDNEKMYKTIEKILTYLKEKNSSPIGTKK